MGANTQNLIVTHKNYYHILGIDSNTSPKDINKAFKKLALKWHPDRHSEFQKAFAHKKFVEIVEAYEVLGNPTRKRKYDAYRNHRRNRPRPTSSYTNTNSTAFKKNDFSQKSTREQSSTQRKKRQADYRVNKKKFDNDLKKWKRVAEKHAKKLAKRSFIGFASSIESISKLVLKGISGTIDIISGNKDLQKELKPFKDNPNDGYSLYQIGFIYHKKGIHDEAIKYYLKAIKLIPNNADLFCNLGRLREEQNEYNRAISCYERAIELEPSYISVYTYLGILHLRLNNYTKAKEYMDTLIEMNREDLAKQIERAYSS